MEGGRCRLTLSDQMSVLDASNLRDLLRLRDDEDDGRDALAGLTLGAVLGCESRRTPIQASRTLLDIIKDEESGAAYRGLVANQNSRKSWKSFKDRLRLRRAGAALSSSSHPVSACDFSIDDCNIQISHPLPVPTTRSSIGIAPTITTSNTGNSIPSTIAPRNPSQVLEENVPIVAELDTNSSTTVSEPVVMRPSAALAAERAEQRPAHEEHVVNLVSDLGEDSNNGSSASVLTETAEEVVAPMRVSLMALLEETDRQAGVVGSTLVVGTEEEEKEDDRDEEGGEEYVCCVCMVRHKGAAFIPCGHTFCRLCSRELWVSRGNCPLCNGFILEILDIF